MRLVAAIPLPPQAREEVAGLLEQLRQRNLPVRWVGDEGLHLTLKFYGDVTPERLEVIEEAVRSAAEGGEPLALRLTELGAFPSPSRARVLWLGIDAPPALELLQDRIERRSDAIGFAPEGAPFRPHVTLGRVREGQRVRLDQMEDAGYERIPFLATALVLFESVRGGGRPRYEPRLALELGR